MPSDSRYEMSRGHDLQKEARHGEHGDDDMISDEAKSPGQTSSLDVSQ